MARNPVLDHHRARKAHAARFGDPARAAEADQELRAAKLESHIRKLVDAAPPLSIEQRTRLAALLLPPTT